MFDLPPYSEKLANEIRSFMDPTHDALNATSPSDGRAKKPKLDVILLTNQQSIHYDASPAVYVTRKSDLKKWKKAFPHAETVMYRLDIPRECRDEVTQVMDGYGPWGWEEGDRVETGGLGEGGEGGEGKGGSTVERGRFVETGRPLRTEEWDDDTKSDVLTRGELPPDEMADGDDGDANDDVDDALYSPGAIRQREERHRLLAVYAPGHTFGSVAYVFPRRGICCSGYALPLEISGAAPADDDDDNDDCRSPAGAAPLGPRLDYRGYMAASASRPRQTSSALSLIDGYVDRFRVVLPARGDAVFLDSEREARRRELMESVGLHRKISEIYGRLGIVAK